MRKKQLAVAALVVTGMFALAACGGDDSMAGMPGMGSTSSPPTSSSGSEMTGDFNDADVTFATNMIPHHQQAMEMAKLAQTRAKSQKVKDLAMKIKAAQDPEIQTMTAWLTAWGKPVPGDMSGMDMSGQMPGMMSADDMNTLMAASGADFDQMFLTMMIQHHQGAIKMAETEQSSGLSSDAVALARQIATAQTEEIATMHALLK